VNSIFFIALRRLRAPLIYIILVFAVAIAGLTLIPGVDSDGRPWHLTLFQAFYFVSYTASTIGFGEIPHNFTDTQRLWVTVIIYLSVVGWAFLVGSLLALAQDKGFQKAIVVARFRRAVRQLREPFYIVCGMGETGLMIVRSLDHMGQRFVVIDKNERRIEELELEQLGADPPAVAADARAPAVLIAAGLLKRECRGVLALSSEDETNLAIAIGVRLLHPGLPTICRSHTPEVTASMTTIGTYQVVNPFRRFGERLVLAMTAPDTHRLLTWLTDPPGTYLRPRIPAPPGHWVICGYGRFGAEVAAAIRQGGFDVTIVDPRLNEAEGVRVVCGLGTDAAALRDAGLDQAAGIVAGTDDDTANLAMAIAARQMRSDLFVIVRQNLVGNRPLFEAFDANMTMIASEIIANECLAILRTRLLADFLRIVRGEDNAWARRVVERLRGELGEGSPEFWSFGLNGEEAPGLIDVMQRFAGPVTVHDLRRQIGDRGRTTKSLPVLLMRDGEPIVLPDDDCIVRPGDEILFAGTRDAHRDMRHLLRNANVAEYVMTGRNVLGGAIWRWIGGDRPAAAD
jgi:Trk K+ transport system NAD-binding subunit